MRFAGQYYDAETGLHYNYHRYYDPSLGRYLRADPIGLAGGVNLYAYVANNPINSIDPEGLDDGFFGTSSSNRYYWMAQVGRSNPSAIPGYHRGLTPAEKKIYATVEKIAPAAKDLGKMLSDTEAQVLAEQLATEFIGPVAGTALKGTNYFFIVFDPFPPPAGGIGDMNPTYYSYKPTALKLILSHDVDCSK